METHAEAGRYDKTIEQKRLDFDKKKYEQQIRLECLKEAVKVHTTVRVDDNSLLDSAKSFYDFVKGNQ